MTLRLIIASALALSPAPVWASSETAALEQRLLRVEDELAIRRIIVEYAVRLDARDFDGYLDLFAADGIWQVGQTVRRGREDIREMLVGIYGNPKAEPYGYDGFRTVSNVQVEVEGDRATARSRHLTLVRGERGNPTPILSGLYEDEFVRENGAWKILRRVDYPIMPTAEEWRQQMAERRPAAAN
jgi:uncharacterized protein (TIGR02246 family)